MDSKMEKLTKTDEKVSGWMDTISRTRVAKSRTQEL